MYKLAKRKSRKLYKFFCGYILLSFLTQTVFPPQVSAQMMATAPMAVNVPLSVPFMVSRVEPSHQIPTINSIPLDAELLVLSAVSSTATTGQTTINRVTFPSGVSGQEDVTTWNYQEATGLLTSKTDDAGQSTTYTYTTGGKLLTRTWARSGGTIVTTYGYDPNTAELLTVNYSDTTPDMTFTYNRSGQQNTIADALGSRTFGYNTALQPTTETISGLYSKTLTRTYETTGVIGRAAGLNTGADYSLTYGYDPTGRFNSIGWNVNGVTGTATYAYVPNSDLLATLTTNSGQVATYTYEPNRNLRTRINNQFNAGLVSRYDYVYDALGRRTSVANTGSAFSAAAFNRFNYNGRSELAESARYLGTDVNVLTSPVTPEYRGFAYDPIGNRTAITEAANAGSYTANNLNQYSIANLPVGGSNTFTHDLDGNLTAISGTKNVTYTYNAENRLITAQPTTPVVNDKKVDSLYDYQGRRVRKVVSNWTGLSWALESTKYFVYDGWNVVEEQTVAQPSKYYVWGLDLSQPLQGAGGIGGLIVRVESATTHHFLHDGNGNVGQLINAATGTTDAHYEYDPYGNSIVATGSQAAGNPYRFSTKYLDAESNLYYYGHRYYDPQTGRWLSRDPLGEKAESIDDALNVISKFNLLYGFVENDPVNFLDLFGLFKDGERINSILVKRKNIKWLALLKENLGKKSTGEDTYGHWWLEIDGLESYGWWPKEPVDLVKTIISVDGELNGMTRFGGTPTTDPHHGDKADREFHPRVNFGWMLGFFEDTLKYGKGKGKKCECSTEEEIKDSLREFAKAYKGSWSYPWGQNCHSFQKSALGSSCLEE